MKTSHFYFTKGQIMAGIDFNLLINIAKQVLEEAEKAHAQNPTPQTKAAVDAALKILNDHLAAAGKSAVTKASQV